MSFLKQLYPDIPENTSPFGYIPELIGEGSAVYNRIFGATASRTESKNWVGFLPARERQYYLPFCTSFSRLNCAEILGKSQGVEINGSDRELGVGSDTSTTGNSLDAVSEYFRKTGVRSEAEVPFTMDMLTNPYNNWQKIFTLPKDTGSFRYKGGSHSYVSGLPAMMDALDYSPIQISCGVGETWEDDGIVKIPKKISAYHAIACYFIDGDGYHIWDTCGKEFKTLEPVYPLTGCKSFRDLPENWKDTMPMITFVHKSGTSEYGFLEATPFTEIYHRAINEADIKFQAEKFGVSVTSPDNTINFGLAKEISI